MAVSLWRDPKGEGSRTAGVGAETWRHLATHQDILQGHPDFLT